MGRKPTAYVGELLSAKGKVRTLSWIVIAAGAVWPVVLLGASYCPWFRQGRIREIRWFLFFVLYALWMVIGAILYGYGIAEWHPLPVGVGRDGLGVTASPGWRLIERWLAVGAFMSFAVALRSVLKKGHWLSPPRWPDWR